MEALLRIIEVSEKKGWVGENCYQGERECHDGVYHINLPKEEGYSRSGMQFFAVDSVYSKLISNGDIPVFPQLEDVPREKHVSFDVYYLIIPATRRAHRITVTRAHGPEKSFVKACFVDGNLIFLSGSGRAKLKVYLFNSKEWNSGAIKGNLPRFWFCIDDQRVDVIADAYFSIEKILWMAISPKSPSHYGIFVNNRSTLNGHTIATQDARQNAHYWHAVLSLALLLPLWLAWMFLYSFFILPMLLASSKCEVRRYWVKGEREDGMFLHGVVEGMLEPGETTRLLG